MPYKVMISLLPTASQIYCSGFSRPPILQPLKSSIHRPRTHLPAVAAVLSPDSPLTGLSDTTLAERLLQSEIDMQRLFHSGLPAPRASEVARRRREQNSIREELEQKVARRLQGASGAAIRLAVADTVTLAATNRARTCVDELAGVLRNAPSHAEPWSQDALTSAELRSRAAAAIERFGFLEGVVREQILGILPDEEPAA